MFRYIHILALTVIYHGANTMRGRPSLPIPKPSDLWLVPDMVRNQPPPLVHRPGHHWGRHRCRGPYCLNLHEVSLTWVNVLFIFLFREISTPKLRGTLVILMPAAANTGCDPLTACQLPKHWSYQSCRQPADVHPWLGPPMAPHHLARSSHTYSPDSPPGSHSWESFLAPQQGEEGGGHQEFVQVTACNIKQWKLEENLRIKPWYSCKVSRKRLYPATPECFGLKCKM